MILRDILGIVFLGFCGILNAQDLPHPKHNLRYHFLHFDYPFNTKVDKNITKCISEKYHPIGSDTFKFFLKVEEQLGYDTIRANGVEFYMSPFYIQRHEVSNKEYKDFLNDSNCAQRKSQKISQQWLMPETNIWGSNVNYQDPENPYNKWYFAHQAYNDYPVVGVSQFQATEYCNWLESKLNESLKSSIPDGYRIEVDLPTAAEFYASVDACILKPTIEKRNKNTRFSSPVFEYIFEQAPANSLNYKGSMTDRMAVLQKNKMIPMSVNQILPEGFPQVHHLLGNVSEWTSTRAFGHLYNHKDYIYTTFGKIIPNLAETHKQEVLNTYLREEASLKTHFAIKGGSWSEDLFYLDPTSVEFGRGDQKNAFTGFRTVIRLKALKNKDK